MKEYGQKKGGYSTNPTVILPKFKPLSDQKHLCQEMFFFKLSNTYITGKERGSLFYVTKVKDGKNATLNLKELNVIVICWKAQPCMFCL